MIGDFLTITNNQMRILEKTEYVMVILEIIDNHNYATSIAKSLSKTQPTVTEQLNTLERLNIVKVLDRKKSKTYAVNFDLISEYFYVTIEEFAKYRKKNDSLGIFSASKLNRLNKKAIAKAVPLKLIKGFLEFYEIGLGVISGKYKDFDEIVVSFFAALEDMTNAEKKYLTTIFDINPTDFETIVDLISFENISLEKTAFKTFLDTVKKGMYEEDPSLGKY